METKPDAAAVSSDASEASDRPRRVIKRYSNRKLYDTKDSRYVTLLQIAEMVRAGEDVQIIDNNSKEDLTEVTLAQIIYEEQKAHSRNVPLQTLKALIHTRTEKVLSELREGPIGRLIPGERARDTDDKDGVSADRDRAADKESKDAKDKDSGAGAGVAAKDGKDPKSGIVESAKETLEDWQHKIDERIKAILPSLNPWQQLQTEVKRLTQRLDELEKKLKGK